MLSLSYAKCATIIDDKWSFLVFMWKISSGSSKTCKQSHRILAFFSCTGAVWGQKMGKTQCLFAKFTHICCSSITMICRLLDFDISFCRAKVRDHVCNSWFTEICIWKSCFNFSSCLKICYNFHYFKLQYPFTV